MITSDRTRLIENAFPLRQASIDSVHEKNVRHGHISTLHTWPARRPLAACRAALIATLLSDPGNAEERTMLLRKLGGRIVEKHRRKKMPTGKIEDVLVEETEGGILHWGGESGPDLNYFRQRIRDAYGGRAPRVLDPFAGGGAIPLEAMRLGCEVTAIDLNPVAWFILKCTLEYPQKLAGQKRRLPNFILTDRDFMRGFFESQGLKGKPLQSRLAWLFREDESDPLLTQLREEDVEHSLEADLAWHVRAWGKWVSREANVSLARFYPTYANLEPLRQPARATKVVVVDGEADERDGELHLCPLGPDGTVDLGALNAEFDAAHLAEAHRLRWVPKPTVAYLWARTVACKQCRAVVPLLKTRWLCKKDDKRVLLTMIPNASRSGVVFGIETDVPKVGGNTAQRREHDRRLGAGTMSRSGVQCPCCQTILTMEDIRLEGRANRLSAVMTAVVVDGQNGKGYRLPTALELQVANDAEKEIETVFSDVPFGLPIDPTPKSGIGASRAFSVDGYGLDQWNKLFTKRQLVTLGTCVNVTRAAKLAMQQQGYPVEWVEGLSGFLALALDRLSDYSSAICSWHNSAEKMRNTFGRFALPIIWDYTEVSPFSDTSGNYLGAIAWISLFVTHVLSAVDAAPLPHVIQQSAIKASSGGFDLVLTDPPYYDAIPYSDLMDFFYVWLRRTLNGLSPDLDQAFKNPLSPKWNHEENDGELIDDAGRFGKNKHLSKQNYEDGMARVFVSCHAALNADGRLVIVFANKQPEAWETLVAAIIKAGFVVDGSWPIATEMQNRTRALSSAALASSVWLVCKKRSPIARAGWDNIVLEQMREKVTTQMRAFWDANIRGPDFVWAATGPAMEAYSQHPVVKKADRPGELMGVSEFLRHVRRMVLDYVVGRVLDPSGEGSQSAVREELDDVTTYYLLHRHDFGMSDAPAGASILYAVSCNLSDRLLLDTYDLLARTGGNAAAGDDEESDASESGDDTEAEGTGSTVRLKQWHQRRRPGLGYDPTVDSPVARREAENPALFAPDEPATAGATPRTRMTPLIDQAHRLMHLWKAGDSRKVDEYLDTKGLRRHALFHQLLQALIELSAAGGEERATLESISNHLQARAGRLAGGAQIDFFHPPDADEPTSETLPL